MLLILFRFLINSRDVTQVVVEQDFTSDYVYYKVPVPWLQVKLLRLLQYYPPSGMSRVPNWRPNVLF